MIELFDKVWGVSGIPPHKAEPELIAKVGQDLGLTNDEVALFLIAYVGGDKAREYATDELGYDYSIDSFLGTLSERLNVRGPEGGD
jgi:hypothetical protein